MIAIVSMRQNRKVGEGGGRERERRQSSSSCAARLRCYGSAAADVFPSSDISGLNHGEPPVALRLSMPLNV